MFTLNRVRAHLSLDKWKNIGGEGRNSKVWIARDTQLEQVVVLKEITKQSLEQQNIDDYFLESKMLNDGSHPHIMPVRYAAEDENFIYITMPYYKKGSINSIINNKMLTVREVVKYSLDFLSGLLYIHIKGMLHLDIKPTNIIINDYDHAILTDFGLSRYLDEDGFADQAWQYRNHRSPESYETNAKTVLDDIYQAGLTMYRMCYGNSVFQSQFDSLFAQNNGDIHKVVEYIKAGEFPNRSIGLPHIPRKLHNIIKKAIHPDPDKRYQSVLDIINDLSKIDENLDWEFNVNDDGTKFSWSYNKETTVVTLNLEEQGDKWLVTGKKYIKSSDRLQNMNKVKGTFNNLEEIFKHVESMLVEIN
jgi:serine/threonine protein kinase